MANTPSPLATAEPWNLVAEGYVAENLPYFEAFAREALRLVPAHGDVVDVAAGPGSLTLQAACTAREVHAVDFAQAMLAQLHERASAAGVANVTTHAVDAQALPFADERFDAAYSMFGVIFFPDRIQGLREMARVLRPGKRAVVASWPPPERVSSFAALFEAMKREIPGIGDAPTALGTAEQIVSEMRAAGFATVDVHEHVVVAGAATPDQLWASFARGGAPAVLMRRRMGEEGFAALSQRIVGHLVDILGAEARDVELTAMLGVGTR